MKKTLLVLVVFLAAVLILLAAFGANTSQASVSADTPTPLPTETPTSSPVFVSQRAERWRVDEVGKLSIQITTAEAIELSFSDSLPEKWRGISVEGATYITATHVVIFDEVVSPGVSWITVTVKDHPVGSYLNQIRYCAVVGGGRCSEVFTSTLTVYVDPPPSPTPLPTETATPTGTPSPTLTPTPTSTPTPVPTLTPVRTPTITPSPTPYFAEPALTKAVWPSGVKTGETMTFTITITVTSSWIDLRDPLPLGIEYIRYSVEGGYYSLAENLIGFTGGSWGVHQITFRAVVTTTKPVTNFVTAEIWVGPLETGHLETLTASVVLVVSPHRIWIPVVIKPESSTLVPINTPAELPGPTPTRTLH